MFSAFLPTSRYGRIVKAVSSGAAARLLSAGIMLVSLPLAVRYLGAERYGVWATITTTVVWINLLDLGIANTLTNSISRAYALSDKASASRYFTNALLITGSMAALMGGVFAVVSSRVNWMKLFNVSANVQAAEVRDQ
jgi:O-antigen/teichoic acid export membrane protein